MSNYYSHSPPPLQHPVPTPAFVPSHIPDFATWGMNDATAQFGMQLGHSAVAAGQDYVQKNFGGFIPLSLLKHHFNVSNSYVIRKLQLVVFPWRHRPWSRKIRRSEAGHTEWQPPRDDINSPDLYIPLMALVTYILVAALQTGLQERFHPQILGSSASRALVIVLIDFLSVKGGCYLLNVQSSGQIIDLIAYGGYKFVGVILTLLTGLLSTGAWIYSLVFVYAFAANAFFLFLLTSLLSLRTHTPSLHRFLDRILFSQLRTLRQVVLPDLSSTPTPSPVTIISPAQRKRRVTFLFLEAVVQFVYMAILVRV
ncbi:YIF1-domain-containing protein [Phlebopus sp. FC_14]|nr:YIF1-domain-containing protein [Phlebopus sp. FC_14]